MDTTKYYFEGGKFVSKAGSEIPKSLRKNTDIADALKKAQDMVEKGW